MKKNQDRTGRNHILSMNPITFLPFPFIPVSQAEELVQGLCCFDERRSLQQPSDLSGRSEVTTLSYGQP